MITSKEVIDWMTEKSKEGKEAEYIDSSGVVRRVYGILDFGEVDGERKENTLIVDSMDKFFLTYIPLENIILIGEGSALVHV